MRASGAKQLVRRPPIASCLSVSPSSFAFSLPLVSFSLAAASRCCGRAVRAPNAYTPACSQCSCPSLSLSQNCHDHTFALESEEPPSLPTHARTKPVVVAQQMTWRLRHRPPSCPPCSPSPPRTVARPAHARMLVSRVHSFIPRSHQPRTERAGPPGGGKRTRMWWVRERNITRRSMPMPQPAVGGNPYYRRARTHGGAR